MNAFTKQKVTRSILLVRSWEPVLSFRVVGYESDVDEEEKARLKHVPYRARDEATAVRCVLESSDATGMQIRFASLTVCIAWLLGLHNLIALTLKLALAWTGGNVSP